MSEIRHEGRVGRPMTTDNGLDAHMRVVVLRALRATVVAYEWADAVARGVHGAAKIAELVAATARAAVAEAWELMGKEGLSGPALRAIDEARISAVNAVYAAETTTYDPVDDDGQRPDLSDALRGARAALAAFEDQA